MNYFPVSLDISSRRCIVIGGGKVAARKVKSLLACQGAVTVISPALDDELLLLSRRESIRWLERGYRQGDLSDAFLVIAATDDVAVQEAVYQEATARNILLNVADVPKWCNFILPATVRRGDLTISVSTAGQSPALAKQLREDLEKEYSDDYDLLLQVLGRLRPIVLDMGLPHEKNKILFANLLHRDMIDWLRQQNWQALTAHIRAILGKDVPLEDLIGQAAQKTPAPGEELLDGQALRRCEN
ncbi:MAG: bifunctional precorrin-2 dehydrogenase/sirohydrochlorin ferrochelatase [Deltaproteobacteria bacterium]|nr:bifunctional precorrin-2 dehydrogenase/sirohydrochlorin ferrochelatase [Deltaproteobacteria bacterium]